MEHYPRRPPASRMFEASSASAEGRVREEMASMDARLDALEADMEGILAELAGARQDKDRLQGA